MNRSPYNIVPAQLFYPTPYTLHHPITGLSTIHLYMPMAPKLCLISGNMLAYLSRSLCTKYSEMTFIQVASGRIIQAPMIGIPNVIVVNDILAAQF